jgi:hypothetical protein
MPRGSPPEDDATAADDLSDLTVSEPGASYRGQFSRPHRLLQQWLLGSHGFLP